MKTTDPYQLLLKAESLGLGEHLRGSEIAYHLEAIEALLANSQTVTKSTKDMQETDVDITVRMLQEKYRVK
ncbi:hypothetical protein [Pseudomonas umsongensis]|uniref:hypothetical protein n=1 Tax=Pseudomonas umsongensis TaxID=198618 RepID=UPI003ECC28B0